MSKALRDFLVKSENFRQPIMLILKSFFYLRFIASHYNEQFEHLRFDDLNLNMIIFLLFIR